MLVWVGGVVVAGVVSVAVFVGEFRFGILMDGWFMV